MALEDLTPAVRVEAILDGADIDPATRLEYFLSKAANEVPKPTGSSDAGKVLTVNEDGDGFILDEVDPGLPDIAGVSDAGKVVTVNAAGTAYELTTPSEGLPSYTSADIGKVLTVVEDAEHPVQTVIVPEQTVVITSSSVELTGVDFSGFPETGDDLELSVVINGDPYTLTGYSEDGYFSFEYTYNTNYSYSIRGDESEGFFFLNANAKLGDPVPGTYIVSATDSLPSATAAWAGALPDYSEASDGDVLMIVDGAPVWVTPT